MPRAEEIRRGERLLRIIEIGVLLDLVHLHRHSRRHLVLLVAEGRLVVSRSTTGVRIGKVNLPKGHALLIVGNRVIGRADNAASVPNVAPVVRHPAVRGSTHASCGTCREKEILSGSATLPDAVPGRGEGKGRVSESVCFPSQGRLHKVLVLLLSLACSTAHTAFQDSQDQSSCLDPLQWPRVGSKKRNLRLPPRLGQMELSKG